MEDGAGNSRDVHVTLKRKARPNEDDDIFQARDQLEEARALHRKHPLVDGHNDLPWALRQGFASQLDKVDLTANLKGVRYEQIRHKCLHTDIPRMREGGLGAQFWSVYVPTSVSGADAVQVTLEQIDLVHRLCEKYPDDLALCDSAAAARAAFAAGKIGCLMGAEGGHQINDSLAVLRMYHRLGVRYLTLTHNGGPSWADPALKADGSWVGDDDLVNPRRGKSEDGGGGGGEKSGGLSAFGCEVVREMNRLGMVVDLSHVHEATMHAVLDVAAAPVLFSHSSSKALCNHPRDVPDDVVRRVQVGNANGGVIMLNFCTNFVAGPFWVRGGKAGATLLEVADHVDHLVGVCGGSAAHVGLGADYDGIVDVSRGLEDVSMVPHLTAELLRRGYAEADIAAILGGNALRVLEACEGVARDLQQQPSPRRLASDKTKEDLDGKPEPAAAAAAANGPPANAPV